MATKTPSIRNTTVVALLSLVASCSSHSDVTGPGGASGGPGLGAIGSNGLEGMGSVGLELTIGNGVHVNQLAWTLSNGTNSYAGVVNITDDAGHEAQSVEFVAGGITAGAGYVVTISGSDSNGDPCTGTSAAVTVVAGATSSAGILVICTAPTDAAIAADANTGVIAVNAPVTLATQPPFQCPGITAVTISPAELMPPETASLTAQETGGAGGTPTLLWTSTCGTITNPTAANATFGCGPTTGTCTVTLTVGLNGTGVDGGSVGQVCTGVAYTTASNVVTCEAQCNTPSDCPASSTLCVVPACVSSRCVVSNASAGTSCTDSGGTICNGGGTCVVPSFDVVRLGNGSAALAKTGAAVFIDQYNLSGTLITSIPLPTAVSGSNQALTLVGTETTEGDLTTSADGRFIALAGHNDAPGTTVTNGNCVAALINSSGAVNTSTLLTSALVTGGVVRSAVSLDGNELWVAGTATDTTGGIWYTPGNVQLVQTGSSTTARDLRIAGGQLYGDSNADPPGLGTVGTGTPTSGSPALTTLSGLPTSGSASPYGFAFFDLNPSVPGIDTLYIADDRQTGGGGIGKWTLSTGGTWTVAWAVGGGGSPDAGTGIGYRGLAGYATGTNVTLMATTGMTKGTADSLVVIVDTGTGNPTQTVVATAPTNETFRGVALPPHP